MKTSFRMSLAAIAPAFLWSQSAYRPEIPKTWDDVALVNWATPVAGLNVRPTHIPAKEYYSLAVENVRTYPVYFPGREPEGYWDMLRHIGPKPVIEPEKLKTEEDWIEAGRRVFDEVDHLHLRTFDPVLIEAARNRRVLEGEGGPLPDGTIFGMRWVPTKEGIALSFSNCSGCHLTYLPDGARVAGAPAIGSPRFASRIFGGTVGITLARNRSEPLISQVQFAKRVVIGATPFFMGPEPLGMWLYRAYGVPWVK